MKKQTQKAPSPENEKKQKPISAGIAVATGVRSGQYGGTPVPTYQQQNPMPFIWGGPPFVSTWEK